MSALAGRCVAVCFRYRRDLLCPVTPMAMFVSPVPCCFSMFAYNTRSPCISSSARGDVGREFHFQDIVVGG